MKFAFPDFGKIIFDLQNSAELFLEKIIRIIIYLSVFLIPLFFIDGSSYFSEFAKVILFYFIIILALIFWLIKIFLTKRIIFQFKFLDIPFILLLFVYFLSSLFSIDKYYSFLGSNLIVSLSFLTVLFLIIFYFFVSRFIKTLSEVKNISYCLLFSLFLILVINILNLFLVNSWLSNFNISINTFYFLLVIGLFLNLYLFLVNTGKKMKILNLILGVLFLLFIYLIDNPYVLLILIISIFVFILLLSFKSANFSNKLIIFLTILLFLTVLILILPVSNYTKLISPIEIKLNNEFGWQITKASLADYFLLGVGPQNFSYSFHKYKPLEFNQTNFWQLSFEKNANFWLEILNNIGILGLFLVIIIFIKYFYQLIIFLKRFKIFDSSNYQKFTSICFVTTILFTFSAFGLFYNFDFILIFLFFLLIALAVSLLDIEIQGQEKGYANKHVINLLFYVAMILVIALIYFEVKLVNDEINLEKQSVKTFDSLVDFDEAATSFKQAINNNPERKDYNLKLVSLLINKDLFLANSSTEFDQQQIEQEILDNLNKGFVPGNKRIDNYLILRSILDNLKTLGFSVAPLQEANLERLIDLDPQNPELYVDRALLNFDKYLAIKENKTDVSAQQIEVLSQKIKNDLEKSIELKNDYILGYFNLGLYYQEFGDEEKALANIEKAYSLDPSQKIIVLSLKKLYLNQDKVEEAKQVLTKYLELQPEDEEIRQMLEDLK